MSSVEHMTGQGEQMTARQPVRGTASLVVGIVAVAMMGCTLLPEPVSLWIRMFPVYLILPTGICAVVLGLVALGKLRPLENANRFRARAGVTLGTVAIVVPVGVVIWAIWVLSQTYK